MSTNLINSFYFYIGISFLSEEANISCHAMALLKKLGLVKSKYFMNAHERRIQIANRAHKIFFRFLGKKINNLAVIFNSSHIASIGAINLDLIETLKSKIRKQFPEIQFSSGRYSARGIWTIKAKKAHFFNVELPNNEVNDSSFYYRASEFCESLVRETEVAVFGREFGIPYFEKVFPFMQGKLAEVGDVPGAEIILRFELAEQSEQHGSRTT